MAKKVGNYERAYQMVWNQYLLLTSAREHQEHRFEVLVLIASILINIISFKTFARGRTDRVR